MSTNADAARQLTEHLMSRGQYGGAGVLEGIVRGKVERLAAEIADEIVASNPELRRAIEEKTRAAVALALVDDVALNRAVLTAVAGALVQHRDDD